MSAYGFRDGMFNVRAIKLGQKKIQHDMYVGIIGSNSELVASVGIATAGTVFAYGVTGVGTQIDYPRTIKITNSGINAGVTSGRYINIEGYTGQGAYAEESLLLKATTGSTVHGSIPFAHILRVRQLSATRTVGTYGTVSIYPANSFGLTEYCDDKTDGLYVREISNAGVGVISTPFAISTNFSKANQTVTRIAAVAASTIDICYRSRFQQRNTDV